MCVWSFHGWQHAPVKPCLLRWDITISRITVYAQTAEGFYSVWTRKTSRLPAWKLSHGAEEEEKKPLPEMILVTGRGLLFYFACSKVCYIASRLIFRADLLAECRRRWWSAKLKTPCPLWWEGWCRTDTTTTTTTTTIITQVVARPADRTACRRASPTAGRISWTSPRSSCSTPPSTRHGRCSR